MSRKASAIIVPFQQGPCQQIVLACFRNITRAGPGSRQGSGSLGLDMQLWEPRLCNRYEDKKPKSLGIFRDWHETQE